MGAVIAFLNQKGGVGKTSCCHHLAGALLERGRRVLLLDNDPQSSLTQGIFGPERTRELPLEQTIAAAYAGLRPVLGAVTWAGPATGIDLVPGSPEVASANVPDPWEAESDQQRCLISLLEEPDPSALVLIDCPPNLHLCSWAALLVADFVVVPVQPEEHGCQGLAPVLDWIGRVRSGPNPRLALAGLLVTMVDSRPSLPKLYQEQLRGLYGADVFRATVPRATAYAEAVARRAPVTHCLPRSPAAAAIRDVAGELLDRVAANPRARKREARP